MAKSEKQINSFIKGLITESSPLTFPENASLDEDNFVLNRDGSRSRRLGIDYEEDFVLTDVGVTTEYLSFHDWKFSGGEGRVSIGVVRASSKLYFFNMMDRSPSSAALNGGNPIEIVGLNDAPMDTAYINNALIITSPNLPYPYRLTYNNETDVVTATEYKVYVRDFFGVHDGLLDNERPTVLSNTHKYNLRNQGWSTAIESTCGTDALVCTFTTKGKYPSNTDVWSLGKIDDNTSTSYQKYSPDQLFKRNYDFNIAPKGKHIIDVFNRGASREEVSGIAVALSPVSSSNVPKTSWVFNSITPLINQTGAVSSTPVDTAQDLPKDKETGSFTTVASYGGRVFYLGVASSVIDPDEKSPNYSGYVFFTQTITNDEKLSKCYQDADPTSDEISDIVPTDGGVIVIAEAINITKLIPTKSSLIVFAENGVWQITGGQSNFSADSYDVYKISSAGCKNKDTIVAVNNEVYYWARGGIFHIVAGRDSDLVSENISLTSIQTFYNLIPDNAKLTSRGIFEDKENKIRWLFNDTSGYNGTTSYNRELVLDLTIGAFYPNTIDNSICFIADYVPVLDYSESTSVDEVYVNDSQVFVSTGEVVVNVAAQSVRTSPYLFLVKNNTGKITFARYNSSTFLDWPTATGGINFTSYLITGYEVFGEIARLKYIPYLVMFFERTEDGYEEIDGGLVNTNRSGCRVQSQWNWSNSSNSGKWGTPFQAYKLLRNYIPTGVSDSFDYGDRVIVSKNKLRGSGRAISLFISSESGKDMKLLGWVVTVQGKNSV